jgi:hypothetical protein
MSATAFPFLSKSYINNGTAQGLYYIIQGKSPNRTVIFEYYTSLDDENQQYCHFQVLFFEAKPGIIQFIYLDVSDGGKSAFVGVQGKIVYEENVLFFKISLICYI